MFSRSFRFLSDKSKIKDAQFLSQKKAQQQITNPHELSKKRLAVLIDGDFLSVQSYFTKVEPAIKKSFLMKTESQQQQQQQQVAISVLMHRVFSQQHPIRQEWQQVVLNRSGSFESFKVQRFIPIHIQMIADAAHISQLRLQNRVQGIVFCTELAAAPLFVQQLKKREEVFSYVDRYVVTEGGVVWRKEFADVSNEGEWDEKLVDSKVVKQVLNF